MPEPLVKPSLVAAVRRQWWVPLAVALVAAAAAGAVTSARPTPLFEARAIIAVDAATLSKYPDLPRQDAVLQTVTQPGLVASIAEDARVATETLAAGLDAYTRDATQSQLVITYRASDESAVSTVAVAAATRVVERAQELGAKEIDEVQRRVKETERALKAVRRMALDAGEHAAMSLRLDLVATEWTMQMRLFEDGLELRSLKSAYSYDKNVTVHDVSPTSTRVLSVVSALVIGLVVGLVIAIFREALIARSSQGEA